MKLTQQQVADATNRNDATIANYENERREVPYDFLEMVCYHWKNQDGQRVIDPGLYHVSVNYILDMPPSSEGLTSEEMDLVYLYRQLPEIGRAFIRGLLVQAPEISKGLPE